MSVSESFRFVQFTDVHLGPLPPFLLRHWNVKRILGYLNWHRGRKFVHQPDVLQRLVEDMHGQCADHIVVTGDLVNIALPEEFQNALTWLQTLGSSNDVTVVPGNHDIYLDLPKTTGVSLWQDYMTPTQGHALSAAASGQTHETSDPSEVTFPFVRRFGDVALIGCNSAEPTPPLVAAGQLGVQQREALLQTLTDLKEQGLVRIVLIHHPPLPGQAPPRCALNDAEDLQSVFSAAGAELVLHGHNHQDLYKTVSAPEGENEIPVIGLASSSAGQVSHGRDLARYNIFSVVRDDAGVRIEMIGRGLETAEGPIIELERRTFSLQRAHTRLS